MVVLHEIAAGFASRQSRLDSWNWKQGFGVQGVLIVIGGVFLAAMFFVLYIRAIAAERRAEELANELVEMRAQSLLKNSDSE